MKIIIVGLGIQGKKRIKNLDKTSKLIATVDPNVKNADYNFINEVPKNSYDTVFICVGDDEKERIINFCIDNSKNILVEKPLIVKNKKKLLQINKKIKKNKIIFYTAYNHRFEPNLKKLKNLLIKNNLGKIYFCRIFYGNGTAKLVKSSPWRDKKSGVFRDLAPHLIDICFYLFGEENVSDFKVISAFNHENISPDHVIVNSYNKLIKIELEMTLCSWKNTFTCDIIGEKGSAHISSLCKWGPSKLTVRKRIIPAGKPYEKNLTIVKKDPTWKEELKYFKKLVKNKVKINLSKDIRILKNINFIENKLKI